MDADFTIRPYKMGDEEEIVEQLVHGFGGWPKFDLTCSPLDHWTWKFIDNPFKMSIIFVAEKDGRIVGCTHGLFSRMKIGKTIKLCSPGADSVVDRRYRKLGLLTRFHDSKKEAWIDNGVAISYGVSSNEYVIRAWEREGREPLPHPLINLIRMRDVDLFVANVEARGSVRRLLLRYAIHLSKLFNSLGRAAAPLGGRPADLEIGYVDRFDERIEAFWERLSDGYSLITERTREYLNWRYRDPRGGVYSVMQAVEDGAIVGYIVFRLNRFGEGLPVGYVVDLCTLKDRLDCAEALVGEAVRFFDDAGVNVINYWGVKGHPYMEVFNRFGFLDSRYRIAAVYSNINLDDDHEALRSLSPDEILFQYGDSDWI